MYSLVRDVTLLKLLYRTKIYKLARLNWAFFCFYEYIHDMPLNGKYFENRRIILKSIRFCYKISIFILIMKKEWRK